MFRKTGIYFFLAQFKQRDYLFLLHFFVYKTYMRRRFKKRTRRAKRRVVISRVKRYGLPVYYGGALIAYFSRLRSNIVKVKKLSIDTFRSSKMPKVKFKTVKLFKQKFKGCKPTRRQLKRKTLYCFKKKILKQKEVLEEQIEIFLELKERSRKKTLKRKKPERLLGSYRFFFVYFLYF